MADSNHASGEAVATVTITFTCLAFLVTALRLYTRFFVVKSAGTDDGFITAAVVFSIALTVTMCEQVRYGMGQHWGQLSDYEKRMANVYFWASVWIYYSGLCFVKVSILLQYLRVFPSKNFRIVTYSLMFVVVSYSLGTMLSAMFVCTPIPRFWDRSVDGTCLNETAVWFANTVLNILTDAATTILPLPVLRRLQLPMRQKVLLMIVFGLGFITCIISILRLHSLYVVSRTTDLSWDNPMPAIWSSTELNVAILCSGLPTLKGLISRIWPKLLSTGNTPQRSIPETHAFAHISPALGRRAAQQEWEQELKSPGDDQYGYHRPDTPERKPTISETDSESSIAMDKSGQPRQDDVAQKDAGLVQERASMPTLASSEDVTYMVRDPTYKV